MFAIHFNNITQISKFKQNGNTSFIFHNTVSHYSNIINKNRYVHHIQSNGATSSLLHKKSLFFLYSASYFKAYSAGIFYKSEEEEKAAFYEGDVGDDEEDVKQEKEEKEQKEEKEEKEEEKEEEQEISKDYLEVEMYISDMYLYFLFVSDFEFICFNDEIFKNPYFSDMLFENIDSNIEILNHISLYNRIIINDIFFL